MNGSDNSTIAATLVSSKYGRSLYCRAEMYAGRVACCS